MVLPAPGLSDAHAHALNARAHAHGRSTSTHHSHRPYVRSLSSHGARDLADELLVRQPCDVLDHKVGARCLHQVGRRDDARVRPEASGVVEGWTVCLVSVPVQVTHIDTRDVV